MPVYMIRAGENGPVKIGYSNDPELRLTQLQVSHWETLRIIRRFEGGEIEEAILHERFADQYIRGEWHHFSRTMLADVGLTEILPVPDEPVSAPARNPAANMDLIRSRRGLTAEIARGLGIKASAISMWHVVPADRLPDVERITGIPRHQLRPDICIPPTQPAEVV